MKVVPAGTPTPTRTADSSVSRAIAKLESLNQANPQPVHQATAEMPVANANNVTPEEMSGLVKAKSVESNQGQLDTNEAPETKAVESEAEVKAQDPLSTQYAILARKEKALRAKVAQQEQTLKAREEALAAKEASLQSTNQVDESKYISKDRLKEDLIGVLAESGISYDEITNMMLEQPRKDPYVSAEMNRLNETIRKLEERLDGTVKNQSEQQEQAYKSAVAQIQRDAESLVNSDPAFETIKETGQAGEIVKLIEATFKEEGYVMSVEEAAQAIEDELVERILMTAKIKKIQDKLKPVAPVEKQPEGKVQSQQIKTLTNSMGTAPKLSAMERAKLAFEGKLNK